MDARPQDAVDDAGRRPVRVAAETLGPGEHSGTGGTALLLVLCAVNFLDAMDVSSMGPTLPKIEHTLHMSPSALQWVVSAYVLGYGGFLLLGGRLADLFSRRKLLLGALVVFAVAQLRRRRGRQRFTVDRGPPGQGGERGVHGTGRARDPAGELAGPAGAGPGSLGRFISIAAAGFALGLVFGGALAGVSWRLTMFLPTAIAVVLFLASVRVVPTDRAAARGGHVDVVGAIMITVALLAVVFGVSHASTSSWTAPGTVLPLAVGLVLLVGFGPFERRRREPLVPLEIFSRRGLALANVNALFFQGVYVAFQFVATLYYQNVLGWSPFASGLAFLLSGLLVLVVAPWCAARVAHLGPWPLVTCGMVLQSLGYLWFTRFGHIDPIVLVLVQQVLVGIGFAAVYPSLNIAAVRNARADEQGLASGMFIAAVQIGCGIVLAVVASVFSATAGAGLRPYRAGLWTVEGIAVGATLLAAVGLFTRDRTPATDESAQAPT